MPGVAGEAAVRGEEAAELVVGVASGAERLLPGRPDVHGDDQHPPAAAAPLVAVGGGHLAELVPPGLQLRGVLVGEHAVEALRRHVLERLRRADRLVHLDRAQGAGHQREVLHGRAPVGDAGRREHVVLPAEAEPLLRPGGEDDLHRLLEHLAVDAVGLAAQRVVPRRDDGAERLGLPGHRAPADAELHAAARADVGDGEVLGEAQRVPLGHDVEHLAEAQALGQVARCRPNRIRFGRTS